MDTELMFSSETGEWATPQDFFDNLNDEFHFTLDACATKENAKCDRYFSLPDDDSITGHWTGTVFCNPPYGRSIGKWFIKAREAQAQGAIVVMLVPARTDTKWFHEHVYHVASEIRFIKGRLKFGDGKNSAPFPSMVVVYRKE